MSRLRVAGAFVAVLFRSLSRDRGALFFLVVLPVVVMVVVGAAFGGAARVPVGVVVLDDTPAAERLVADLATADGLDTTRYDDVGAAEAGIRRGDVSAALVVPVGFGADLAAQEPATVDLLGRAGDQGALTARVAVSGVVDRFGAAAGAAQVVVAETGGSFTEVLDEAVVASAGGPGVTVVDIGGGRTQDLSRFSLVAPQNLVLFVFITSASGGAYLVTVRRAGVLQRVAATRAGTGTVLVGLATGWFAIALAESLLIVAIGALGFGVRWGDPLAAAVLVATFAAVAASAGLLVGALGRDEDKVGSLAPIVGIVLGALGGCMVPVEIFPEPMVVVAHAVPQYWALTAWQQLVFDGAHLSGIAGPVLVLLGFAAVLLAAATRVLHRQLARG